MSDGDFWRAGLRFACTRCSRCCRHTPGYVFLSDRDLGRLARAKGVTNAEFLESYCRKVRIGFAGRVSLREKTNLDCILWEADGCSVYAARPLQCRSFPFWSANLASAERWEQQASECPGIGLGKRHGRAAIARWLARRQAERLIEW